MSEGFSLGEDKTILEIQILYGVTLLTKIEVDIVKAELLSIINVKTNKRLDKYRPSEILDYQSLVSYLTKRLLESKSTSRYIDTRGVIVPTQKFWKMLTVTGGIINHNRVKVLVKEPQQKQ